MKRRLLIVLPLIVVTAIAAVMWVVLFGDDTVGEEDEPDAAPATAVLSGQVVDSAGRPVEDANVFAEDAVTRTDEEGRFSFDELPASEVRVDVTADGYRRGGVDDIGRPTLDLGGEEPVGQLRLLLPRAASLSGRIVAGGEPVEAADISLSYVFAEGLEGEELPPYIVSKLAVSDENGHFSLPEIAPGRLQILVESGDHPFTETDDLYFRPGQSRDEVVVDLAPSGRLRGTARDQHGEGIAAEVRLIPEETERSSRILEADEEGRFSVRDLTEGTYSAWVRAEGYRDERIEQLVVEADETTEIDVTLEESRGLLGRVVEPDGTPVDNAHVMVTNGESSRRIRAGEDGRFAWEGVEPGDWTAVASSPGHLSSEEVVLQLDEEAVLEVEPGGKIRGLVVDPDGNPYHGYSIEVGAMEMEGDIQYRSRHMPTTAEIAAFDGTFDFGPLRPGRYRLVVQSDDYAPATTDPIDVDAGETSGPLRIQLEEGGAIEGIVRNQETDEPIHGVEVTYMMRTSDNRPPSTRTDENGHYRLEDLPTGRSSIRFSHGSYNFEIIGGLYMPDGGVLTHDIELEPLEVGDQPGMYLQGIGATLHSEDDGFRVVNISDDTPARGAGIEEGDVIVGINGNDGDEMTIDMAVEQIRGEPGEAVELRVRGQNGSTRTVEVDRERVFIPQERPVRPRR